MNEEQIKELQQELNRLNEQLQAQQKKIEELIQKLSGQSTPYIRKASPDTRKPQQWSVENFIGLRLVHFIGIIVLVIGLSIGVKYAIDKDLISEGMRIILAYGSGFALF